jgi:hypothetical protein
MHALDPGLTVWCNNETTSAVPSAPRSEHWGGARMVENCSTPIVVSREWVAWICTTVICTNQGGRKKYYQIIDGNIMARVMWAGFLCKRDFSLLQRRKTALLGWSVNETFPWREENCRSHDTGQYVLPEIYIHWIMYYHFFTEDWIMYYCPLLDYDLSPPNLTEVRLVAWP